MISAISFAVSFGNITKTHAFEWDYSGDDPEYMELSFTQNAVQMYRGYFNAFKLEDDNDIFEYEAAMYEQANELADEYGDELTPHVYGELYSKLDFFGYGMINSMSIDGVFFSTLEFFVVIILLFILQLMPLIIIGVVVYKFINNKEFDGIQKLLLASASVALLLAFFIPNFIWDFQSNAGGALVSYFVLMLFGFMVLHINQLVQQKKLNQIAFPLYIVDTIIVVVLLILASGTFIRVGYEDSPTKTYWGAVRIEELSGLINVYDEEFEYDDSDYYYSRFLPNLSDDDLTSSNVDHYASTSDYSYLFGYQLFDSETAQNVFIGITVSMGIGLFLVVLVSIYFLLASPEHTTTIFSLILRILTTLLFIGLLVLSIIATVKNNAVLDSVDEPFVIRISFGLIIGIVLSIVGVIINLFKVDYEDHEENQEHLVTQ